MSQTIIPAVTSILALLFSLALLDQWRDRRRSHQLAWAFGTLCFAIGSACEAIALGSGWSEQLYKAWYLTGAVLTAGWLGLGTALLLGRTRFGYTFAFSLFLAGLFTLAAQSKNHYEGAGSAGPIYFVVAAVLAVLIGVLTFRGARWALLAAGAVMAATVLGIVLVVMATLAAPGYALDPTTGLPVGALFPGTIRLLTPLLNITGAFSLVLGALFTAYVFMPKRPTARHSLDPRQPVGQLLANLAIVPVTMAVEFVRATPATIRAFAGGKLNSRVPSTILIALGGMAAGGVDALNRFGSTQLFEVGKLVALVLIFSGFLVSAETFHELRIPFTRVRLLGAHTRNSG